MKTQLGLGTDVHEPKSVAVEPDGDLYDLGDPDDAGAKWEDLYNKYASKYRGKDSWSLSPAEQDVHDFCIREWGRYFKKNGNDLRRSEDEQYLMLGFGYLYAQKMGLSDESNVKAVYLAYKHFFTEDEQREI